MKAEENLEIPGIDSIGKIVLIYLLEKEAVHFFDLEMLFSLSFPGIKRFHKEISRLEEYGLVRTMTERPNNGSSSVYKLTELGMNWAEYFHNEEISKGYPLTRKLLAAYMISENPELKDRFNVVQIENILKSQGKNLLKDLEGAGSFEGIRK